MRSTAALLVLALIGSAAEAQQPAAPTPTVTLHGVVTTANDALPRVRVAMTGTVAGIIGSGVLTVAPDPQLLESLSSLAMQITLGEGQSRDLTLRLTRR